MTVIGKNKNKIFIDILWGKIQYSTFRLKLDRWRKYRCEAIIQTKSAKKIGWERKCLVCCSFALIGSRVSSFYLHSVTHTHTHSFTNIYWMPKKMLHIFRQIRCRRMGWLRVEPMTNKQISGLQGGEGYNRNIDCSGNTEDRKQSLCM